MSSDNGQSLSEDVETPNILLDEIDSSPSPTVDSNVADAEKTTSLKGMSLNLANSTIGAGIVSLPFAVKESGFILGALLLIIFGVLTNWTLQLLVRASRLLEQATNRSDKPNGVSNDDEEDTHAMTDSNNHSNPIRKEALEYEEVASEVLGKIGYIVVAICSILINFGAATGYLIVCGDLMVPVLESMGLGSTILVKKEFLITLIAILFVFPLTLVRKFASLRWISYIAMTGVFLFVGMVIVQLFVEDRSNIDIVPAKWSMDIFLTTPLFTFAYACHTNLLNAYSELREDLRPKMHLVIHGSVGLTFFAYSAVGELGYLTFGERTARNVLTNFPEDSVIVNIIRVVITISVLLSYPLCSFPTRHSLNMLVLLCQKKDANKLRAESMSWRRNLLITIPFFLLTLLVALVMPDIVAIFGLTGATSSTVACYILPPLINLRILRVHYGQSYFSRKTIILWFTMIVGLALGIVSTVVVTKDMIENRS